MRHKSLNLEWKFAHIPAGDVVQNALLYFNETNFNNPSSQNVICIWHFSEQKPRVIRGEYLFPGRIFVTYGLNVYKLTLINLQYNNTGSFYLRVAIRKDAITPSAFDSAVIRISKINSKYGFLIFCCFSVRV